MDLLPPLADTAEIVAAAIVITLALAFCAVAFIVELVENARHRRRMLGGFGGSVPK